MPAAGSAWDVVAGDLEAVAETLLGNDVHVAARSRATRAVQAVVRDHEVAGAAADVDGGQRDALAIRFVVAGQHVEELFGVPREILIEFRV
ncbi:hypothetical protein G6F40_017589 [Rhizopus arrhizus]|nr:hypothetical protein G6F40_017589 [Rhizopus arrhizus]